MHYYTTPVIVRDLQEANSHTYFEKLEKPSKNPEYKQMIQSQSQIYSNGRNFDRLLNQTPNITATRKARNQSQKTSVHMFKIDLIQECKQFLSVR